VQSAFEKSGAMQREWLRKDLEKVAKSTPLLVVLALRRSTSYIAPWNFWTDDAEEVAGTAAGFRSRHGAARTYSSGAHQSHRNIQFHGIAVDRLALALCPAGMPALTVQMNRPIHSTRMMGGPGDGTVACTRTASSTSSTNCGTAIHAGQSRLFEQRRQERCPRRAHPRQLLMDSIGATP